MSMTWWAVSVTPYSMVKRAEVLDLGTGGEAGVLVLGAFRGRPKSQTHGSALERAVLGASASSPTTYEYIAYSVAGELLRDAACTPRSAAASLQPAKFLSALEDASENTFLGRGLTSSFFLKRERRGQGTACT